MHRHIAVALFAAASLAACGDSARIIDPTRSAGAAAFDKGGNSDAAHTCQQGGWQHFMRSDGTLFSNTGDCVSYAAHGGTLVPIPVLPIITSFTFDGLQCPASGVGAEVALITAVFSNGTGTVTALFDGSVTPVTSGQQAIVVQDHFGYTLTVTNSSGSVSETIDPLGSGGAFGCGGSNNRLPVGPGRFSSDH